MAILAVRVGRAALYAIVTILFLLNLLSGIVSGIWLAVLGKWLLVCVGLVLSFLMPTGWSLIYIPAIGFGALLARSEEKGSRAPVVLGGFIISLYTHALLGAWVMLILTGFSRYMGGTFSLPVVLWAYATVISPVGYMARQEPPDQIGTTIGLMFVEVAFILLVVINLFGLALSSAIFILSGLAMVFSLGVTALTILRPHPRA